MKVLVVGSGAREHAIATCLDREEQVEVVVAPGNPGIALGLGCAPLPDDEPQNLLKLAQELACDLVVIGPEAPLVAGAADVLRSAGIPVFGPSSQAARLEGSKSFAKEVMVAAGVPTADSVTAVNEEEVSQALRRFGAPYVVKADGLAAGKGVVVTADRRVAREHALRYLPRGPVVVEEYLNGREVSLFFVCDGQRLVPLTPARDYKRLADGGSGPNTGGMGAYSPLLDLPPDFVEQVTATVAQPVLEEMASRGVPFVGLLYCGLSVGASGIKVIEFNARFGDPETQVVLARLASPLSPLLLAAAKGNLDTVPVPDFSPEAAVCVVLASAGYPQAPAPGRPLFGLEQAQACAEPGTGFLFAGVRSPREGETAVLHSHGGRVLSAVALAPSFAAARRRVYRLLDQVKLSGGQFREDIALGAVELPDPRSSASD